MRDFAPLRPRKTSASSIPITQPVHDLTPLTMVSAASPASSPAEMAAIERSEHSIGRFAIQRAASGQPASPENESLHLQQDTRTTNETGEPCQDNCADLPVSLKAGIEKLSGISLDAIQVHYNSPRPAEVDALAYTQGTQIHVGPGQEQHLPHEAWHVVQQKQGKVQPTMQMKRAAINTDADLEKEADVMGAKAAANLTGGTHLGENTRLPQLPAAPLAVGEAASPVIQRVKIGTGRNKIQFTREKNKDFITHISIQGLQAIQPILEDLKKQFDKANPEDQKDIVWAYEFIYAEMAKMDKKAKENNSSDSRTIEKIMESVGKWISEHTPSTTAQTAVAEKDPTSEQKEATASLKEEEKDKKEETKKRGTVLDLSHMKIEKEEEKEEKNTKKQKEVKEAVSTIKAIENEMNKRKEKMLGALTVAFDKSTKKYFVGKSSDSGAKIWQRDEQDHVVMKYLNPKLEPLREKLDKIDKSLDREVWVCGEVDAAIKALKAGSTLDKLEFATVEQQNGVWKPLPPCPHCQKWAKAAPGYH